MKTMLLLVIMTFASANVYSADKTSGYGGVVDGNRYEISWVENDEMPVLVRVVKFGDKTEPTKFSTTNGKTSIIDNGAELTNGVVRVYSPKGSSVLDENNSKKLKKTLGSGKPNVDVINEIIRVIIRG